MMQHHPNMTPRNAVSATAMRGPPLSARPAHQASTVRHTNSARKAFSPIRPVNHPRYIPVAPAKEAPPKTLSSLFPSFKCMPTSTSTDGFEQSRILCYGDSLTAGLAGNYAKNYVPYADRLSELLGCQVDHVGLCGMTTSDMTRIVDQQRAVDVLQNEWTDAGLGHALRKAQDEERPYTAVIILAGTNDLQTASTNEIVRNLMELHGQVRRAGAVSVACAVPKHGAIVCEEYSQHLDAGLRRTMNVKVDDVNARLREAVARTNESCENGGWIAFVDAHSEVLKKAGDNKAQTYAGFPTLGEYNNFTRVPSNPRMGDVNTKIDKTPAGQEMKRKNSVSFDKMEDALHLSPAGYRSLAESVCEMCKQHLVRLS